MRGPIVILLCLVFSVSTFRGMAQVDLKSGAATFSYPIFNWSDDLSNLNLGMSISYNSKNGLRVDEVASNVGQGWSLNAGGSIMRIQVGQPDDQVAYLQYYPERHNDLKKIPPGYLYNSRDIGEGVPVSIHNYPIHKSSGQVYREHMEVGADREIDYFAFNFNGKSGMFILDKNTMTGTTLGYSNLKINFTTNISVQAANQIRTSITGFTILDKESGLEYVFNKQYLTKLMIQDHCDSKGNRKNGQPNFKEDKVYYESDYDDVNTFRPWVTAGWFLTEIRDVTLYNTSNKVVLNYTDRNISSRAGYGFRWNDEAKNGIISLRKSISRLPVLSSIIFPDQHSIVFNYGADRFDLTGDKALSSIDVKYKTDLLSRIVLEQSYVFLNRYGTPTTDLQKNIARLYLTGIKKQYYNFKDEDEPYLFDYYTGSTGDDIVPPLFTYTKDLWGYYNGTNTVGYFNEVIDPKNIDIEKIDDKRHRGICFLRNGFSGILENPKLGYAKNGLLKSITTPKQAKVVYEYAQRKNTKAGADVNYGGVSVSKIINYDASMPNGCLTPMETSYSYTLENNKSSLWGVEDLKHKIESVNEYKMERGSVKWFGSCKDYKYPGILNRYSAYNPSFMQVLSSVLEVVSAASFGYTVVTFLMAVSTSNPYTFALAVVLKIVDIILSCQKKSEVKTTIMYVNQDLNSVNGLPIQYKRVSVTDNNGEKGKTVHEFTSNDDYPVWEPLNPGFNMKQRYAYWLYGLPKKTTIYDATNNKVKETTNEYTSNMFSGYGNPGGAVSFAKVDLNLLSCNADIKRHKSRKHTAWMDDALYLYDLPEGFTNMGNSYFDVNFYNVYTGWVGLNKTIEKVYSKVNNTRFVQTEKSYLYTPNTFLVRSSNILNSDGTSNMVTYEDHSTIIDIINTTDISTTEFYATRDRISNLGLIQPFLLKTDSKKMSGTSLEISYSSLSHLAVHPSGRILSKAAYRWDNNDLAVSGYRKVLENRYDTDGRIISLKNEGSRKLSYIYGYDKKKTIATIVDADFAIDYEAIAYTSFEENTDLGGWQLTGTPNFVTGATITGKRYLQMSASNSIIKSNVGFIQSNYTLSFWASDDMVVTLGTLSFMPSKQGPTKKGLKYYEYIVWTDPTTTLTITGVGKIDELRLHPFNARMSTKAYDPIIGVTEECDINNRTVYYEYDKMGRLKTVKDVDGNIIKVYEYGTKKTQAVCPNIFYNKEYRELVYKNNCGAGYIGGSVEFVIPAAKYSSAISQKDADILADIEFQNYAQNYANTNATCIQLFYNDAISETFYNENCDEYAGQLPVPYTYTVPAGKYAALTKPEANQMARDEIDESGQITANRIGGCTMTYDPIWVADEMAQSRCYSEMGPGYPSEYQLLYTDVNPNSPSHGMKEWKAAPMPEDFECPPMITCTQCDSYVYMNGMACIEGTCEFGVKVYLSSVPDGYGGYTCTFRYEFSDGSYSYVFTETSSSSCL